MSIIGKNAINKEKVLEKLLQLKKVHQKYGDENRLIGVDTLAIIFNISFEEMATLLNELVDTGCISLTTLANKKTGKNRVQFIRLLNTDK